jgi:peptidyl-prolyl cis-trans isomerase A (cyclophilin A)
MSVTVAKPIANIAVNNGAPAATIPLTGVFRTSNITGTVVRFTTEVGGVQSRIDLEIYDKAGPGRGTAATTARNFLNYVNAGRYNNTIFHRALNFTVANGPAQFLQGGSFIANPNTTSLSNVPTDRPIALEYADNRPNTRGTIAMARTSDPNSATSGFFFNTIDNSNVFNFQNPYAVFGRVLGNSQNVLDQYSQLPRINTGFNFAGSGFQSLQGVPVSNSASGNAFTNLVYLRTAAVVPSAASTFTYDVSSSNTSIATAALDDQGRVQLTYTGNSGTATITVVGADFTGATAADTFTVTIGEPVIQLTYDNVRINDGQSGVVNLLTAFTGQSASRVFSLRNTGNGPLNLGDMALPQGFSLATPPAATLAPGATTTFTLAADTSAQAELAGVITIASNAGDKSFSFPVSLSVGNTLNIASTGASRSVVFTDGDNSRVTVGLTGPGAASLALSGSGLSVSYNRGVATVTGVASLDSAATSATTTASSLNFVVTGGDRVTTVGSITTPAGSPLRTLSAAAVNVTEFASFASPISTLTLGSLSSAVLSLAASTPAAVTLGDVMASTVSFAGSLRSLTARNVVDTVLIATVALPAIKFNTLVGSTLRVGVGNGVGTPDSASDFVPGSAITSLTLSSRAPDAFSGSELFAANLGRLAIGQLTDAGDRSLIVGTGIVQLSGRGGGNRAFSLRNINFDTPVDTALAAAGVPDSVLDVTIVN